MLTESNEMYLLTIYRLTRRQPVASTTAIAARLNISRPSVTEQLKRLRQRGYVNYEWREGASLTEAGQRVAQGLLRKHRLLELFLARCFGYGLDEVHEEACRLEHQLSERLTDGIEKLLGYPPFDPHGQPIPGKQGELAERDSRPLTAIAVGQQVRVCEINDGDLVSLRYLLKHGIIPGVQISVVELIPQQGPLMVKVNDETMAITYALAQEVYVCDCFD